MIKPARCSQGPASTTAGRSKRPDPIEPCPVRSVPKSFLCDLDWRFFQLMLTRLHVSCFRPGSSQGAIRLCICPWHACGSSIRIFQTNPTLWLSQSWSHCRVAAREAARSLKSPRSVATTPAAADQAVRRCWPRKHTTLVGFEPTGQLLCRVWLTLTLTAGCRLLSHVAAGMQWSAPTPAAPRPAARCHALLSLHTPGCCLTP